MGTTDQTVRQTPTRAAASRSARRRHWRRWVLAGVAVLVALVVLVVVAVASYIKDTPAPPALTLPTAAASAPTGPLDGTWDVAAGSTAGFRVLESAVGVSNDTVGRTNAVTGTIGVAHGQVTAARLRVDLTTIKVAGRTQPQFATSLDTRDHPSATVTLTRPVTLSSAFTSGATITATATGQLTMAGVSRPVTLTVALRRDGAALQVAGSIPVAFSHWAIKGPQGFGFLGSLANHGVAQFRLVLGRQR